ncbi:MAG: serine/threonine-protein phosphatase [Oscillospiraceae bacterium]|nr:serine/threonine-protein phosphatase [Oscillospiraceae bacterium]
MELTYENPEQAENPELLVPEAPEDEVKPEKPNGLPNFVIDGQPVEKPEEDSNEQQEGGTAEPATPPDDAPKKDKGFELNPWIIALLAIVAIIGVVVVLKAMSKRKKDPVTVKEESTVKTKPLPATAPVAAAPRGTLLAGAMQHIGAREDQQDSYGLSSLTDTGKGVLAVVADGMGGLANGKLVSSTLVNCFLNNHKNVPESKAPQEVLLETAVLANAQINQLLKGASKSGSTLVAAIVRQGFLHFLTVGDSRIYLYRGGALLQLNREHIYQEELAVKAVNRMIPTQQVTGDRQAHALTSYFGIGTIPHLDRNDIGIKLVAGDKILLASDGVFGTLSQSQMEQALRLSPEAAAQQMKDLILKANRPYQDNNTAVVLEYR